MASIYVCIYFKTILPYFILHKYLLKYYLYKYKTLFLRCEN